MPAHALVGVGLGHSRRRCVPTVTEDSTSPTPGMPAELPTTRQRDTEALERDLARSSGAPELVIAIARRSAVLAAAADHGPSSVRELVALETGAFESRVTHQAGPSAGAIAALALLDAWGIRASDMDPWPEHSGSGSLDLILHPGSQRSSDEFQHVVGARDIVRRLTELHERDATQIDALGKAAASSHRVHRALERWPIASVTRLIDATGLQIQAVTSSLHRLRGLGIVREITRRHRHRLYGYEEWLAVLDADVERVLSGPEAGP